MNLTRGELTLGEEIIIASGRRTRAAHQRHHAEKPERKRRQARSMWHMSANDSHASHLLAGMIHMIMRGRLRADALHVEQQRDLARLLEFERDRHGFG